MRSKTQDIVYIGMFAILLAICAWIAIPTVIPFTLSTFGIFLTLGVLGGRRGTIAVLVYLLLGLVGIPVFSGFRGGIGALLGNTGGYLVGYLFLALVVWGMEKWTRNRKWLQVLSMVLGLALCYAFGTIWFIVMYAQSSGVIGLSAVLGWCVLPYVIPDLIKLGLAMGLSGRLRGIISKGDSN